jgi:hypothetical protein
MMTSEDSSSSQQKAFALSHQQPKQKQPTTDLQRDLRIAEIEADLFLDKTTLLLGGSKTGKSVLTKHILTVLSGCGEILPILFCPTAREAGYYDFIPSVCIYPKPTIEIYVKVYNEQATKSSIYQKRTIENYKPIFETCASTQQRNALNAIMTRIFSQHRVRSNGALRDKLDRAVTNWMESIIVRHRAQLQTRFAKGTDMQKMLIHLAGTKQPRTICIWDDCAAFVSFFKSEQFKESSYNGRHIGITHIVAFQDLNSVPSDIRRNAHRTVFTAKNVATCYFDRASTGLSRDDRVVGLSSSEYVFNIAPKEGKHHYKLLYVPNMEEGCTLTDKFYAIRANPNVMQKLGSHKLWALSEAQNKLLNSKIPTTPHVNAVMKQINAKKGT